MKKIFWETDTGKKRGSSFERYFPRLELLSLLGEPDWAERFRIEYLGQLRDKRSVRKSRPLTVGEVVVVENSLKNRTLWSLARVIQLIPGKDGHIRVARVKTETGELVRPVQRLYNLELQEPEFSLPKDLTDSVIRTRRGRKVTTPKNLTYA
ncbi:integrase catalytic domain-containing protein [Trichonephila inaurata madagascariensis]|uniref:Integrase catalytic domain-containing protein n=1 Tax=Trichonephila inaurata madagascariensis TaxID=2747483 RepID=A0A8X6YVD1_9ARAC|nr:integrase catalytic domain-containing protein [Trichonephila inaurata madagascariensis]